MRVAILGSNGQLGSDLMKAFADRNIDTFPLTHDDVQVENLDSLRMIMTSLKPDCIINTTAFHVVPQCEKDPQRAFQVNSLGALNVAKVSEEIGAIDVYFSTDYVFDGAKLAPYIETDAPNPLNAYAGTKLLGEYHTLNNSQKAIVLRVSGLYGRIPCRAKGGNFITTMIKAAKEKPEVKVVQDEILTPTPTQEIANKTIDIIRSGAFGLFHLTSEGECSWYEFAKSIFDALRISTPRSPWSVKDFPMVVKRPLYSVLENSKLKSLQIQNMQHWNDALRKFLQENYL
jgi:dTDP-4-dehydrorhamnose reductase